MNPLDYDPSYPRDPATLAQYIRKYRKDKGLTMGEFAREIGVHEFTVINWEVRGKVPRIKNLRERLTREVEGVGRFLPSLPSH
jgi:DNA-binding transcriptional regulator YiaG